MTTKAEQAAALLDAVYESGEWKGFCPIHQQEHFRSPASAPKTEARNLLIRPDGTNGFPRYLCNSRGCDQQNLGAFLGALREVVGRDLVWTPSTKDDPELRQPFDLPDDETLSRWTEALVSHPGWQPMRDWLWDKCRVDSGLVRELGLGAHTFLVPEVEPNFGERLVIPVRNVDGELLTLRCLNPLHPEAKRRRLGWPSRDGSVLVGADGVREPSLLVVEGEPDWLYLRALGLNAVGKTGAQGIPADLRCVERAEDVVLGFDADSAGQRGARSFAKALAEVGVGPVYLATLPLSGEKSDKDWCDWLPTRTEALQLVKEAAVGEPFDPLSELDEDRVERGVIDQLHRDEVRRRVEVVREAGRVEPFTDHTLSDLLAVERSPKEHLVRGLHAVGHNTGISAQYKTGKTTLMGNLIRSLVDNVPFLDRFETRPLDGNLVIFNYEMDSDEFLDWLDLMQIHNTDRVRVRNLRGSRLSLANDVHSEMVVSYLRASEAEVWILDPRRRAFRGFGSENENADMDRFTEAIDQIKSESGCPNSFVTAHTGRADHELGDEHARGATAWDDWQDNRWIYTRGTQGIRFLRSDGRLKEVEDFAVHFDPVTRLLSGSTRTRADVANEGKAKEAARIVTEQPGLSAEDLKKQIPGKNSGAKGAVIQFAVDKQWIERRDDPDDARKKLHFPGPIDDWKPVKLIVPVGDTGAQGHIGAKQGQPRQKKQGRAL